MLDQIQESRLNERPRGQARVNPWNVIWELENVGETLLLSVELLSRDRQDERIGDNTKNVNEAATAIIMRLEDALQPCNK